MRGRCNPERMASIMLQCNGSYIPVRLMNTIEVSAAVPIRAVAHAKTGVRDMRDIQRNAASARNPCAVDHPHNGAADDVRSGE
jgi:hypothetical protein